MLSVQGTLVVAGHHSQDASQTCFAPDLRSCGALTLWMIFHDAHLNLVLQSLSDTAYFMALSDHLSLSNLPGLFAAHHHAFPQPPALRRHGTAGQSTGSVILKRASVDLGTGCQIVSARGSLAWHAALLGGSAPTIEIASINLDFSIHAAPAPSDKQRNTTRKEATPRLCFGQCTRAARR